MERRGFDRLRQGIRDPGTRRETLLAALAVVLGPIASAALPPSAEGKGCLVIGRRCGRHSGQQGGSCKRCCSRHATKGKHRRCACRPNGFPCGSASTCCGGICDEGVCTDGGA
jgi:hypothetical protein